MVFFKLTAKRARQLELKFFLSFITLIYALLVSSPVYADQSIPMVRVLCMPEAPISHFSAKIEHFAELSTYIHNGRGDELGSDTKLDSGKLGKNAQSRVKKLEKYGLLFPSPEGFSYSCSLQDKVYKLEGRRPLHRERGMCGGDPRTTISLSLNNKIIFDDVFF